MQLTSGNAGAGEADPVQDQCGDGHEEDVAQQLRVEEVVPEVLAVLLELRGDVRGGPVAAEEREPAVEQLPGLCGAPVFPSHEDVPGGLQPRGAEPESAEDGCRRHVVSRWRDEALERARELTAGQGAYFGEAEQLGGFVPRAGAAHDHGGQPEADLPGAVHYRWSISV